MKKALFAIITFILLVSFYSCDKEPSSEKPFSDANPYVFYLENGLYDIGQYKSGEKYEHFTGEPVYEFIPRDDYGPLLPFSGGLRHYHTKEDPMIYGFDMSYSEYGLCTTDGKVVVEPVYAYIHTFTAGDGFKYFDLTYENDVEVDEDGRIMNYDDVFIANKRVIIPSDGSWKIDLENGSYISGVGDGIITVCEVNRKTDEIRYKLYDYEGKHLFDIDSYEHIDIFSCGYAAARIYPEYSHDTKDVRQNGVCVYLDKSGNVALDGGYTDGTNFNKFGVASVQIDGDKYALINKNGEFLTEQVYDSLYTAGVDGYYQGFIEDKKEMHVFDGNGKLVGTVSGKGTGYMSLTKLPDGDFAYSYYDSAYDSEMYYRLSDNSPIVCKENGKMPNTYSSGDLFVYKDTEKSNGYYGDETSAVVFNADGETVAKLDRITYVNWMDSETSLMGYTRKNPDAKPLTDEEKMMYRTRSQTEFVVLDTQSGQEVCVIKDCHYAHHISGFQDILAVQTEKGSGSNLKTFYYFYDLKNKCILKGFEEMDEYTVHSAGGKHFLSVCRSDSVTVYDENFNIVLKKYLDKNV